jgi:NitT/TauT family transport system permease protein
MESPAKIGSVPRRPVRRTVLLTRLRPLIGLGFLILIWEIAVRAMALPTFFLPAPSAVLVRFLKDPGTIVGHLATTAFEAMIGLAIAIVIGCIIAFLVSRSLSTEQVVLPYLVLLQVTPIVAIAPLLIIWLGPGTSPKIAIAVIIAFFPIVVNTTAGLKSASVQAIELMRSYGASERQEYRYLRVPLALPYLFAALKISAPLAVVGAIVAEMVGSDKGLGFIIIRAKGVLDTELLFVGIICAAFLGISAFLVVDLLERRFLARVHGR